MLVRATCKLLFQPSLCCSLQLAHPRPRAADRMHVTLSHAQRALVRSPFVARHICSGTVLRGTAVEAKRGAKALLELEDEKTEDAVGVAHLNVFDNPYSPRCEQYTV